MNDSEGVNPNVSVYNCENGYIVVVTCENPKYKELERQTKKLGPGSPILLNPQIVEDPNDPTQVHQAIGLSMFKGFPDQYIVKTYVFENWPKVITWLAANPMGVLSPEPNNKEETSRVDYPNERQEQNSRSPGNSDSSSGHPARGPGEANPSCQADENDSGPDRPVQSS